MSPESLNEKCAFFVACQFSNELVVQNRKSCGHESSQSGTQDGRLATSILQKRESVFASLDERHFLLSNLKFTRPRKDIASMYCGLGERQKTLDAGIC
jgi:hypothetical protein